MNAQTIGLIAVSFLASNCTAICDDRCLDLEGQSNFRDIGGYQTKDGKSVKSGIVFRSGRMPKLTDDDVAKLEQLGIKTVVNFLTPDEIEDTGPNRLPGGAKEMIAPIESDGGLAGVVLEARKNADFSKLPPDINPNIHRLLVKDAREQYATLLREIATTEEPIVFHCSHGIHRTGTATAILLWSLGVPWETVRQDYLLSNTCRKHEVDQRLAYFRNLVAEKHGVAPDQVDMTNFNAFYILKGSYIDASRDEILKEYGGIQQYLTKGLEMSEAEIQQLRDRLIESPTGN